MLIIKRNGTKQEYTSAKMTNFLNWLIEGSNMPVQPLIIGMDAFATATTEVTIDALMTELLAIIEKQTSRISTGWLKVSGKLYVVRLLKRHRAEGLDFIDPASVETIAAEVASLQSHMKLTNRNHFQLEKLIREHSVDWNYTLPINDAQLLVEVYGRKLSNNLPEPPLMVLMRQAIDANLTSVDDNWGGIYDWGAIGDTLNFLKMKAFTNASPLQLHAGKEHRATASCTLITVDDSTHSIMDVAKSLALQSKHGSGNGIDVQRVAGGGRFIETTQGVSSGVIPFLRVYASILDAFNQSGKRKGAGVVTMQWWHPDVREFLWLKNTTGVAEQRIRGLKYALATNKYLYDAVRNDAGVVLFCPDALYRKYGRKNVLIGLDDTEFRIVYTRLIEDYLKGEIAGTKVKARDIYFGDFMTNIFDHGNMYETHTGNIANANMTNIPVTASNLCQEVLVPSNGDNIGLCFLNATNPDVYGNLRPHEKRALIYTQVKTLDNQIDTDFYATPEKCVDAAQHGRYIGLGLSNLHTFFVHRGVKMGSQESIDLMAAFMDDWSYNVIEASVRLARERGPCSGFDTSKWSEGALPMDLAPDEAWDVTTFRPDLDRWQVLRDEIKAHGMRNTLLMALAPTASSGASRGLTEGIDPITTPFFTRDGSRPVMCSVNEDQSLLKEYEPGYQIGNKALADLAIVRQIYVDQAQSWSMFVDKATSAIDHFKLRDYMFERGIKTTYYMQMAKTDLDQCESCS